MNDKNVLFYVSCWGKFSMITHFILHCKVKYLANSFFCEVIYSNGLLRTIIPDGDVRFTSYFGKTLLAKVGMNLHFSSAYHS